MQFDASTPTGNYTTYEQAVKVPLVYTAGPITLTENDAAFFNQQVATAVINRFGAFVRKELKALDDQRAADFKAGTYTGPTVGEGKKTAPAPATVADLTLDAQAKINELFTAFEPGVSQRGSGDGSTSGDPVSKEMHRLAGVAVRELYKAKGFKYNAMLEAKDPLDPSRSMYAKHVAAYLEAKGDQLRAIVEAQFAAMKSAASDDGIDLGEPEAEAA